MRKRIEMDLEEKEKLIRECLRRRMREAARRAGVGHSTMHTWISRYRAEGVSALSENGNA
ncbi:leucine zipper domain-containing protein [Oscillospiraceae bacterium 38-13]